MPEVFPSGRYARASNGNEASLLASVVSLTDGLDSDLGILNASLHGVLHDTETIVGQRPPDRLRVELEAPSSRRTIVIRVLHLRLDARESLSEVMPLLRNGFQWPHGTSKAREMLSSECAWTDRFAVSQLASHLRWRTARGSD